jgi:hypothetical protein
MGDNEERFFSPNLPVTVPVAWTGRQGRQSRQVHVDITDVEIKNPKLLLINKVE